MVGNTLVISTNIALFPKYTSDLVTCYLDDDILLTSTSCMVFPIGDGMLTFERTFSLRSFVNMQLWPVSRRVRAARRNF